jgi:hypothetical protein
MEEGGMGQEANRSWSGGFRDGYNEGEIDAGFGGEAAGLVSPLVCLSCHHLRMEACPAGQMNDAELVGEHTSYPQSSKNSEARRSL